MVGQFTARHVAHLVQASDGWRTLGGVLTPTGVGTMVEEGKQKIELNGKVFLLETALRASDI